MFKTVRLAVATCVLVAAGASAASAEIVFLASGRTVSVKSHATVGETVVLALRSGGEVTLDKSLIEKIEADEVPHPEPVVVQEPADASPLPAVAAEGSALLRETAYSGLILAAAEAHGVDPVLVQALIQVESNYKPRARSSKGAMGLMQLMPSTAREYRVRNAYDPAANISAGVQKLKGLLDKWGGDVRLALASYNAGEGAVARFNGIPPYRETQKYVSNILSIAGLR
ncbi:MAG: lytic transglycosylase domain-containing protein [Vicinamibacterales bacterium]